MAGLFAQTVLPDHLPLMATLAAAAVGLALGLTRMAGAALAIPAAVIFGPPLATRIEPLIAAQSGMLSRSESVLGMVTVLAAVVVGCAVSAAAAAIRQALHFGVPGVLDHAGGAIAGAVLVNAGFPAVATVVTTAARFVGRMPSPF